MKQSYSSFYNFLVVTLLCLLSTTFVFADDDEPDPLDAVYNLETGKNQLARQEVTTRLEPLGFGLMGDTIDPVTGTLMFHQTDVSLPGNSDLEVAIRRMASSGEMTNYQETVFGDWMLETPQISRIVNAWKQIDIDNGTGGSSFPRKELTTLCELTSSRLSRVHHNPTRAYENGVVSPFGVREDEELDVEYQGETYSDGVKLSIPGNSDQNLISILNTSAVTNTWAPFDITFNQSPVTLLPLQPGSSRSAGAELLAAGRISLRTFVTKDHWVVECQSNNTLLATSPTGTRYKFTDLIFKPANNFETNKHRGHFQRLKAVAYATEVTDVHGNWVKYDYTNDGRLTRIYSNDGREIRLTYFSNTDRIRTVSANGRTWRYEYRDINKEMHGMQMKSVLSKVTQPDGNYWEYDLEGLTRSPRPANGQCQRNHYKDKTVSIKHPYGVEATYRLGIVRQGRQIRHNNSRNINSSLVRLLNESVAEREATCHIRPTFITSSSQPNDRNVRLIGEDLIIPTRENATGFTNTLSVFSKTLSSPSIPTSTWQYDYEEIDPVSEPEPFKSVTVTDPVGRETVSHFYNEIVNNNRHLLPVTETRSAFLHRVLNRRISKRERFSKSGQLLETTHFDYETNNRIGIDRTVSAGRRDDSAGQPLGPPVSYLRDIYNIYRTSEVTERDGDTYTREYSYNQNIDARFYTFGQPTIIRVSSNVSQEPRETVNVYTHRKDNWVLSLVRSVTVNGRLMTRNRYDDFGRNTSVDQYGHRVADLRYHDEPTYYGALRLFRDAEGRRTEYLDYHRGIARTIERNDGSTDYVDVDDNGWVVGQTDYRGFTTAFERDDMGRVTKIIPSKTEKNWSDTDITYDFGDTVTQTIRTDYVQEVVTYDNFLRAIQEKLESTGRFNYRNVTTVSKYNAAGEMLFRSFPANEVNTSTLEGTNFTYDGLGRRKTTTENVTPFAKTTINYLNNHRTQTVDPLGFSTINHSNGFGELVRIQQPLSVNTYLGRNQWGQLTTLRQAGGGKSFTQYSYYDSRQRLCRHRTPEGGDSLYQYDDSGRMVAYAKGQASGTNCATPSGINKVAMGLDSLGRVESMNYTDPNTADIQSTYDANGNVLTLNRDGTNLTYEYNERSELTREILAIDGRSYIHRYSYNNNGVLTSADNPLRGAHYSLDGLGREQRLQIELDDGEEDLFLVTQASYHANGLLSSARYRNGQTLTQTLTPRMQPLRTRFSRGSVVPLDYTYTYDARSSITNIDDKTSSNFDQQFTYDALDRLITAKGPWGNGTFKYDALGNLYEKTLGSRKVTIRFDGRNRAISNTDTANPNRTMSYDNRGNVTKLGDLSFVYDNAQQPVSVSGKANGTYVYDGNFKRVKSVVDGKTIYNIYNAAGQLTFIDAVTDGNRTEYFHFNGKTVARVKNEEVTFLHKDHRGSAAAGTNRDGDIVWTEEYTPYGEKRIDDEANHDQGSFTGHIDDSATGLTYMQARYYDPTIGRFLSIDPVRFENTGDSFQFNRYIYANDNPIKMIDPNGLDPFSSAQDEEVEMFQEFADASTDFVDSVVDDTVEALRTTSATASDGSDFTALAAVVSVAVPGGQFATAPFATGSTIMSLVSLAAGLTADVIEGAPTSSSTPASVAGVMAADSVETALSNVLPGAKGTAAAVIAGEVTEFVVGAAADEFTDSANDELTENEDGG